MPDCTRTAEIEKLKEIARSIRCDIVNMVAESKSGHPGGSLSATDIVTALYFSEMHLDPANPGWPSRDRFILSKGHCCPVLYSALIRRGFMAECELSTLRKFGSKLQGHPCMKKAIGLDMTSGSLGNGPSIGLGMGLGAKLDGLDYRVFVMVGDGELQEGMVWEALMAIPHFKANNVVLIVDKNGLQVDGPVSEIMEVDPVADKLRAFRWNVREIDGHDMGQILDALTASRDFGSGPHAIIAHTVKGKGVSFMEGKVEWHGLAPTEEQRAAAILEIIGKGGAQNA